MRPGGVILYDEASIPRVPRQQALPVDTNPTIATTAPNAMCSFKPSAQTIAMASSRSRLSMSCDNTISHRYRMMFLPTPPLGVALLDARTAWPFGAIRAGGAIHLFSREYIGLLVGWFLIGYFLVSTGDLAKTMLLSYLGYTDFQYVAAKALFELPWLFKFLPGYLTDCLPINRRRRKPYIILGWGLYMTIMIVLACIDLPKPFYRGEDGVRDPRGPKFVVVLIVATLAHIVAQSAIEGVTVELSQREGELVRGRLMAMCFVFRYAGSTVAKLAMSLAFNGPEFQGIFAASVPIRAALAAQGVLAGCGVVAAVWWLKEDKLLRSTQHVATQARDIWRILQQPATWRIAVFGFVERFGTDYQPQELGSIVNDWLGASSVAVIAFNTLAWTANMIAAAMYVAYLTNTNWRKLLVLSILPVLLVAAPIDMTTVFDGWRCLAFFYSRLYIVQCGDGLVYLLRSILIIEVAAPGYEAVTYGLISTVYNLGGTVMAMSKNLVATRFDPAVTDLKLDTLAVRWHVAYQFFAQYGIRILVVLATFRLLPRQKRHVREIASRGDASLVVPIVLSCVFIILFGVSFASTLLAVKESTSCLVFAGGRGCTKS